MLELVTGGELFDRYTWNPCDVRPTGPAHGVSADCLTLCVCRIVERGYYSERDAAHVIKQILEAVAVSVLPSLSVMAV